MPYGLPTKELILETEVAMAIWTGVTDLILTTHSGQEEGTICHTCSHCPGRLCHLRPWRFSKPNWIKPWAAWFDPRTELFWARGWTGTSWGDFQPGLSCDPMSQKSYFPHTSVRKYSMSLIFDTIFKTSCTYAKIFPCRRYDPWDLVGSSHWPHEQFPHTYTTSDLVKNYAL